MKTNWTDAERAEYARVKKLHTDVRAALHAATGSHKNPGGQNHRYLLLAWAYARGLPYRRVERNHCKQILSNGRVFEHNIPDARTLAFVFAPFFPTIAADLASASKGGPPFLASYSYAQIRAWLANPDGAIAAPAPRPKKPYVVPSAFDELPIAAE